jgi:hypothetical protein
VLPWISVAGPEVIAAPAGSRVVLNSCCPPGVCTVARLPATFAWAGVCSQNRLNRPSFPVCARS